MRHRDRHRRGVKLNQLRELTVKAKIRGTRPAAHQKTVGAQVVFQQGQHAQITRLDDGLGGGVGAHVTQAQDLAVSHLLGVLLQRSVIEWLA